MIQEIPKQYRHTCDICDGYYTQDSDKLMDGWADLLTKKAYWSFSPGGYTSIVNTETKTLICSKCLPHIEAAFASVKEQRKLP